MSDYPQLQVTGGPDAQGATTGVFEGGSRDIRVKVVSRSRLGILILDFMWAQIRGLLILLATHIKDDTYKNSVQIFPRKTYLCG